MKKIIAIGAGLVTSCFSAFSYANDPYEAIIADQQGGRYQQALVQVDKLLLNNANDLQAMLLKGNVHRMMGNAAEASYIYKQIIKQFPDMPEAYNNLAVIYANEGQTALAIETLQQAFATSESYSTAYQNLRTLYSEMASTAYRDALDIKKPQAKKNTIKLASINQVQSQTVAIAQTAPTQVITETAAVTDAFETTTSEPVVNVVNVQKEVNEAVEGWSKAWSSQNSQGYFNFYHPNFTPPKGMNRKAWQTYRGKRITRPKYINIEIVGLTVQERNVNEATAIFEQHYRSDTYADTVVKKLTLKKYQGNWMIVQEVTL